ncbi:MAG: hypothetical protein E5W15_28980 [Mesorhizobium sp.]|uniref:hypothetical protein n=1 Tax=unclassified Mesorhizobium TaxID=325217 RepID=UPI000FCC85B9|nr:MULTISPECIES: hypothetical protein [unclassified Mesorhizobium]RUW42982.1 hypothetical protein EOA37_02180 [Mesorhizobium sp. M2A.F.Ca.ET.015.02.1.1]RVC93869.1 hypothetical protein EN739_19550 [Mesorhizobium sp. M2A.F.Ca.ET.017.03.2.1]RVC99995.1 hypothetical protein EN753_25225 [Mesorhizobium sp. M2A.F.Ca.ET.029.05.1.1]RWB47570.1 MAG: hypothetical protein EOQ46_05930 [Mesorhizobium sp.]RWB62098.1 MAG: hypothetical protein EOQ48_11765 [Mesorhizobium sp.]
MSKREFSKVSSALWRSKRFLALSSDRARLLHFYFITCQHQNSSGAYCLPKGYALADLGWPEAEYRIHLDELVDKCLVAYDESTEEVFVCGWFKVCPPQNEKHATGIMTRINDIESDAVRTVALGEFKESSKSRVRVLSEVRNQRQEAAE